MEGLNDKLNHLGGLELLTNPTRYIQLTLNIQTFIVYTRADIITSRIRYMKAARGI